MFSAMFWLALLVLAGGAVVVGTGVYLIARTSYKMVGLISVLAGSWMLCFLLPAQVDRARIRGAWIQIDLLDGLVEALGLLLPVVLFATAVLSLILAWLFASGNHNSDLFNLDFSQNNAGTPMWGRAFLALVASIVLACWATCEWTSHNEFMTETIRLAQISDDENGTNFRAVHSTGGTITHAIENVEAKHLGSAVDAIKTEVRQRVAALDPAEELSDFEPISVVKAAYFSVDGNTWTHVKAHVKGTLKANPAAGRPADVPKDIVVPLRQGESVYAASEAARALTVHLQGTLPPDVLATTPVQTVPIYGSGFSALWDGLGSL